MILLQTDTFPSALSVLDFLLLLMRWTAPPDRREIAFILLCLGAYLISYNIEITLQTLGIDAAATKGAVLSRLGVGSSVIGEGGLKPVGWRDKLEKEIFGNWEWLPGQVVESEAEISQRKGSGRHGAQWVAHTDIEDIAGLQNPFGDSTVDNVLQHWGDHIPQTQVINHASGAVVHYLSITFPIAQRK